MKGSHQCVGRTARRSSRKVGFESLETRDLFAGITYVHGTIGDNQILITSGPNGAQVQVDGRNAYSINSGTVVVRAYSGDDGVKLQGTAAPGMRFVFVMAHGNDLVDASEYRGGGVRMFGGFGNDLLFGGAGKDFIVGGADNDRIDGGSEADFLDGGLGNDHILGGVGAFRDFMLGGAGNDVLRGGAGRDYMFGEDGNDTLRGGTADDLLVGGNGTDTLLGQIGHDAYFGGLGSDTLIDADLGSNYLPGNSGEDVVQLPGAVRSNITIIDPALRWGSIRNWRRPSF